jgi:hypothetical protein
MQLGYIFDVKITKLMVNRYPLSNFQKQSPRQYILNSIINPCVAIS